MFRGSAASSSVVLLEAHVRVWIHTCTEQTAIRQKPRPCTSNPCHHLHRPFPACRVIPAPALPPLPSHTYQSPAAVPLPDSGSSSLENLEEQQQPVLLPLFSLSHFAQILYHFFAVLSFERFISRHFPQITTCRIASFSVTVSKHIVTGIHSCVFLPFSTPRVPFNFRKNSNNIPETSWVAPVPLPFHNFLLIHPIMGQIFILRN